MVQAVSLADALFQKLLAGAGGAVVVVGFVVLRHHCLASNSRSAFSPVLV